MHFFNLVSFALMSYLIHCIQSATLPSSVGSLVQGSDREQVPLAQCSCRNPWRWWRTYWPPETPSQERAAHWTSAPERTGAPQTPPQKMDTGQVASMLPGIMEEIYKSYILVINIKLKHLMNETLILFSSYYSM